MKRSIIISFLLGLCLVHADAQRLTVEKETLDCGQSGYNIPVTATFVLVNQSSKRLVIDEVKSDCGCTQTVVPKKELGAGDRCEVKLVYDGRMLGHYQKQAVVQYHFRQGRDLRTTPVYLTMKGVVLTELKDYSGTYPYAMGGLLADRNFLEFDDVNRGDHPEQIINILNNTGKILTPNIQHLPPYLSAIVMPEQLRPGQTGRVQVILNSQFVHDFGLTQTSVYLASYLGEKVSSDNELPISVVLLPDLKVFEGKNRQYAPELVFSEPSVELGLINGKNKKKCVLTLTNKGRTSLEISSIQMFTSGMKVTLGKRELKPGEQTKLKISGNREQLLKARSKPRVLMITNDPNHSKVVIPIHVH